MERIRRAFWLAATAAILTPLALAQGFNNGGGSFGNNNGDGGGPGGFNNGGFSSFLGFDISSAMRQRAIHGILASVAFVIAWPLGAVALRFLPGKWGFWTHVGLQMAGWVLYMVAAILGFMMVRNVTPRGEAGWLLSNPDVNYHPILGIILFILVAVQPALGYLHHRQYKLYQRRRIFSYLHLWNGRILMVVGIINGGFGLHVSGASGMFTLVYTIVAAVMGGLWVVLALLGSWKRRQGASTLPDRNVRLERIDRAVMKRNSEHGSTNRNF